MKHAIGLSGALCAAAMLAACASGPRLSGAERLEMYRANAGEPVPSFSLFGSGRLSGWTPLGDSALVVWPRNNEAYLVELHGPCHGLEFTHAIGLTSSVNRVHARFDRVLVRDPIGGPCTISEIRPLDVKALRDAQQQLREAQVEEREGEPGADGG